MYRVINSIVKKDSSLFEYLDIMAHRANNLYNAALFRERQMMTSRNKEAAELQNHQIEVIKEVEYALPLMHKKRTIPASGVMNYGFLNDVMKLNMNADYRMIPAQMAQNVLKQVVHDIDAYFKALKVYKADPSKFLGCPHLPKYKRKNGITSFTLTNQDCNIRQNKRGNYHLKFPYTKETLPIGKQTPGKLMEVHIIPKNGIYQVSMVFEDGNSIPVSCDNPERIASIDIGVDNLMAVTNNIGVPALLIKGTPIKSVNQMYNKAIAKIMSDYTLSTKEKFVPTKKYNSVTLNRNNRIKDYLFKTVKYFMTWCVENRIDTIVIGKNDLWKQKADMGKRNNQTFVQMPFAQLIEMIEYSAERIGIRTVEQEESYTSKASYLDSDDIPVYSGGKKHTFSGKRIKRGLYKSEDGTCINADLNGSANIMRKAFPKLAKNICFDSILTIGNAYTALNESSVCKNTLVGA